MAKAHSEYWEDGDHKMYAMESTTKGVFSAADMTQMPAPNQQLLVAAIVYLEQTVRVLRGLE